MVRPAERSILVVTVAAGARKPARDALRAAHVPPSLAARLSSLADELIGDVRASIRGLRRSPGLVLSVVLTLAVAMGGATALFGVADSVFRGSLPFDDADRLLRLRDRRVAPGGEPRVFNMSPLDFHAIRRGSSTLTGVAAATGTNHVLTGGDVSQRVNVLRVSEGWTAVLGARPVAGRTFTPAEEALGGDAQVALISHALWESRFGGSMDVVGQGVPYDAGVLTIVGVMPPGFRFPYEADVWTPWRWDETDGVSHDLHVVGRMTDDADLAAVRRDLDRLVVDLQASRPETNADLFLYAETLRDDLIREGDRILVALGGGVAFLLLLACANVATLLLARFISQRREVGIRVALGAGRVREVRGFAVEAGLLFLVGGGLGLVLAVWLGDLVGTLIPDGMRAQFGRDGVELTGSLAIFAVGVSLVAGAVVGAFAGWRGTRGDVARVLRDGDRGASAGGTLQRGLVAAQLALALSLLLGAGTLFDHFRSLSDEDLGMELEGLYTLRVSLEQERFAGTDARNMVVGRIKEALTSVPGVTTVGYTTVNPLCCGDWGAPLAVEGRTNPEGSTHLIHHRMVGPDYFDATGTPLLRGRTFDDRERPGSPATVIVDEPLAERFWPGEDPLGRRIRLDRPGAEWMTIVGVVGDVEESGDYSETWYLPYTRDPVARSSENLHFMIRASDPSALEGARSAIREVDPDLAVYEMASMASLRSENISQERLGAAVGTSFAAFGLLLAALGVFGTLAYHVGTRSREIGTRIALGAHPGQVTRLVLRRAVTLGLVGIGGGSLLGVLLAGLLRRVIPGVETVNAGLMAVLAALLLSVAVTAAAIPARRAARVDPMVAFRD
jgi:predicted permease